MSTLPKELNTLAIVANFQRIANIMKDIHALLPPDHPPSHGSRHNKKIAETILNIASTIMYLGEDL